MCTPDAGFVALRFRPTTDCNKCLYAGQILCAQGAVSFENYGSPPSPRSVHTVNVERVRNDITMIAFQPKEVSWNAENPKPNYGLRAHTTMVLITRCHQLGKSL